MSSDFELTYSDGILLIKLNNKLELEQATQLINHIAENYDYRFRLWDLGDFEGDFSLSDLQAYSDLGVNILVEPGAIALYSPGDLLYGEMRQYEAIRSLQNNVSLSVFRDYDEALAWLVKQRDLLS